MRMNRVAGVLLLVLGLSACERWERVIGTLEHYGDTAQVVVPDTVARGAAFPVRVTTYGGGCIRKGSVETDIEGLRAMVTPYNERIRSGWPVRIDCTDDLAFYTHTATLRFTRAGVATVVIQGLRKPEHDTITVTRTVVIR